MDQGERMGPKAAAEFIGTFFLVLTIALVVGTPGIGGAGPLAVGSVLAAMICASGHVSMAHFNPAVTLAMRLRGFCSGRLILPFLVAQFTAAAAAALIGVWVVGGAGRDFVEPLGLDIPRALAAEVLFSFALVYVILGVATVAENSGRYAAGLAIGLVVAGSAFVVGPVSGAALNPAVAIAFGLVGWLGWDHVWVPVVGSVAGAVAAWASAGYVMPATRARGEPG